MSNKVAVVCGNAKVSDFVTADCDSTIRLHQYGLEDDFRVTLGIEGLRGSMYKDVPARLHDFLDIATYVYIADQCVKRGVNEVESFGTTWHRRFKFVVPVKDLEFWDSEATKATLQDCLSFLSDDTYEFVFTQVTDRPLFQAFLNNLNDCGELFGSPDQVMLYSGGLDSLAGVIDEAVNQKRRVLLVNHRSTQKIDKKYAVLAAQLEAKCKSNPPQHMRVTVHKKKWMNAEYTQRARSFLYAALAGVVAKQIGHTSIRFYENGVISLNLPISAEVVGGKATRTTHPRVLHSFSQLLSLITDTNFRVENPFDWRTKTEVVDLIVKSGCQDLVKHSISCTHTWEMTNDHSHCGTCSQCIDRRFAIIAAKAEQFDQLSNYKVDVFTQSRTTEQKVGADKTLYASYIERSNQVRKIETVAHLIRKYPELTRAIPFIKGDAGAVAQRCFDLYKKHAADVNSVVDEKLAEYKVAIRERTIAVDSMLRIVYESNLPTSFSLNNNDGGKLAPYSFRKQGYSWRFRFADGEDVHLLPAVGANYLHQLLLSPGTPRSIIEIVCGVCLSECGEYFEAKEAMDSGLSLGPNPLFKAVDKVSDWTALGEYKRQLIDLRDDQERAREENDSVKLQQCEDDIVFIAGKIREAMGVGGKLKSVADKRKNVRDAFRNNINRFIEKQIEPSSPSCASHLRASLQFGMMSVYQPVDPIVWDLRPFGSSD
jgi:7-cyano-7-deazaguanine synthase in queuosine biosynthesis